MPKSCIVDSSAIVALLDPREEHHPWAKDTLLRQPQPWFTCEPALTEAFFLLGPAGANALEDLLRKDYLKAGLALSDQMVPVLNLRARYSAVPMSLADACLVVMSEVLPDPVIVTTDSDFRVYRRHHRQIVPCLMPR